MEFTSASSTIIANTSAPMVGIQTNVQIAARVMHCCSGARTLTAADRSIRTVATISLTTVASGGVTRAMAPQTSEQTLDYITTVRLIPP